MIIATTDMRIDWIERDIFNRNIWNLPVGRVQVRSNGGCRLRVDRQMEYNQNPQIRNQYIEGKSMPQFAGLPKL